MFRKFKKSALTAILILLVSLSVSIFASAAGNPAVAVKHGGSTTAVTETRAGDGNRIYAPYDSLFSAMGATATYDTATKTVTAVSGKTTVAFTVGKAGMTVTAGSVPQTLDTGVSAYQDTESGKIYIPVRYAAQALGYIVSWDGSGQTVVLQAIDDLIAQSGATYSLMDRLLASQKDFNAQKHGVSGDFSLSMTLPAKDGTAAAPLTATGKLSGLVSQNDAEMSLKMKSNASTVAAGAAASQPVDDQTKQILLLLDNLNMDMIINSQNGMLYIQSPLLSAMASQKSDAWLSLDLSKMNSGVSLSALSSQMAGVTSFKDYLATTLKSLCLADNGSSTAQIQSTLTLINALLSDQSYVKDGDNYVATLKASQLGVGTQDLDGSMELTLKFNGTAYNGMALDASFDLGGKGTMTMTCTADTSNNGSIKMNMTIPSALTMDMTATYTYSGTTQAPATQPPAGSTILPIDGLLSSVTPGLKH